MTPEHRQTQRFLALDPARSVVVEACAGSGKTWLLSGRLLRLLLAGVKPGEILAITYTRKAAREIEARLRGLLAELARADDDAALKILSERGLSAAAATAALPRARGLFEAVLAAEPPITITTFHGWFARLLGGAPLQSGVAGCTLDEAAGSLLDEAWAQLAADCARAPDGPVAYALLWLYAEVGRAMSEKLLRAFVDRRAEWRVWLEAQGGVDAALAALDAAFGAGGDPFADCFTPARLAELEDFARLLGLNTAGDQALGNALAQAVVDLREAFDKDVGPASAGDVRLKPHLQDDAGPAFTAIRAAFLTATGSARARKPSAAQAKRLGAGEDTFLTLHEAWSARLIAAIEAQQDQRNAAFNRQALVVGEALLAKLEELKRSRRVMDFGDLEAEIDRLLHAEGTAAWLQARLDARYRHILLDEFQDTNPLQWRILRAWLDGYAGTGVAKPGVFLVGDPKQSIYRFRRAEPKLFAAAGEYFQREFGAEYVNNAHTFRNAAGVVALVNAAFDGVPGFSAQTTEQATLPARVELLPLIPVLEAAEEEAGEGWRLPLEAPRVEAEDLRRAEEAALIACRINEMVGCWQIGEGDKARPARYADVLILTRAKTRLATYEAALREAGIPFVSPGQGGLLATLEAQDLLAVLRFLADPADNLRLAHSLRTPAFGFTDEDLLALSAERGPWWPVLRRLGKEDTDATESRHSRPSTSSGQAGLCPSGNPETLNDTERQSLGPRLRGDDGGVRGETPFQRAVRLLSGWLEASAHLPAHDLIDRIFHEADWFARTRAALPAALWPGVHANLEALLELALNVDAGRYPSLTRFVDELARLSAADEEAPDEGLVASAGEGLGRVRIMTIHGSKGLEAPIVWLIDANATPRNAEGYGVVMDWPAEADLPQHFSLLGRVSEVGPARRAFLEAEKLAAEREELNLLYVAITRAEQVLIVSGIAQARKSSVPTAYSRISEAMLKMGAELGTKGELPAVQRPADFFGQTERGDAAAVQQPAVPKVGEQRSRAPQTVLDANAQGMAFGSALHAWLEAYCAGWPLPKAEAAVEQAARKLLGRPTLTRFFDPAQYRRAGNETSFVGHDGKPGRIDRWVECEDAIWVLDYKSGHAPADALLADYRLQIAGYRALLTSVFVGKPVKALLVFTEGGEVVVD
ncbi:UvrD-helicase domain-containing protein [Uliginosibacterium aquaticum]|uniref:DNA 3'-5' helicase n=1 Tax=Uliginosibacterium aquaticum TaxID=2731212 RepID=A0ABX2IFS0_9RHOO|nr:UvrD-helicase domain-containing protein [Uliginosibacterium aquaticum]NSL54673.1 UvrD-helicase domain-containing protein [Uliginosibacterium aquaticum]